MITIRIAEDFSSSPGGRFPEDGPYNGTFFRERLLVPALEKGERVQIVLDGVSGFGSSFLEEAFGGLVRVHHLKKGDLKERIEIVFTDPALMFYADSITDFIEDAEEA